MSTLYGTGTHRLIYKTRDFATGATVTAYIWNPSLTKSALQTFTEVSDGLYYLDYAFAVVGTHFGKFYEGGVGTTTGTFRIEVPSGIAKNVALPSFDFYMLLTDGLTAATGKTVTGQIRKDNGSFAAITNAISEVGSGLYAIASGFTQAEMNADKVTLKFTADACKDTIIVIYPT